MPISFSGAMSAGVLWSNERQREWIDARRQHVGRIPCTVPLGCTLNICSFHKLHVMYATHLWCKDHHKGL